MSHPLSAPCPLCETTSREILTTELRRGNGVVFFCGLCDHGFLVSDQLIDANEYYASEYRKEVSHVASGQSTDARELFQIYSKYQHERLRLVTPYLTPSTTLLEVGASAGQFLAHVKNLVLRADAIELDRDCVEFLRSQLNIDADSEILRASKFSDEQYDIVCSFQVLEHIDTPISFLRDLRQSMKSGGTAFIEVPNLRDPLLTAWDVEAYRKFYYHSAHLHYFTQSSLRKAAIEAGFDEKQIRIEFIQDYNLLNHLNWLVNGTPQATCDPGLSPVHLDGANTPIARWLESEIQRLNTEYVARLADAGLTSNLMMIVSVD